MAADGLQLFACVFCTTRAARRAIPTAAVAVNKAVFTLRAVLHSTLWNVKNSRPQISLYANFVRGRRHI